MGRGICRCGHVIAWVLLVWIPSRLLLLSRSARATTGSPLAARGVLSASVRGQSFACRRAGRGGTRTNISTTRTSLSPTTCQADTTRRKVCFLQFVAAPTRHTYNHQCLHSHTRTCGCVQPEHNPECACRVAHVYSKPDRHAFEAPRHVPAPTPLAHSCEACAGRCAMGL